MRHRMRCAGTVAMLIVAGLMFAGCEDSPLTAPTDGIINLAVNPSTIVIDPNTGPDEATAQVIASAFDNSGKPLQNISVLFSTGGGLLASAGKSVKTDVSGIAIDTLTVTSTAPATFKVQVQSSAIIQSADVAVQTTVPNEQPLASILEQPIGSAQIGQQVLFDGSNSVDPDGQITCYQWSINSTDNAYDELIQGTVASALQKSYPVEQTLSIVLRVSDRTDAGALCIPGGAPVPEEMFSPRIDALQYEILCLNDPPVANAGGDLSQGFSGTINPSPTWSFRLDGSRSTDPDGVIRTYKWNCGNGLPASTAGLPPGVALCTYIGFGDWLATLEVCDDGNGTVLPNGTIDCQKCDEDTAQIRVVNTDG